MKVTVCDRCGQTIENRDAYVAEIAPAISVLNPERYDLCEQCFTTIREVLQDGEVK